MEYYADQRCARIAQLLAELVAAAVRVRRGRTRRRPFRFGKVEPTMVLLSKTRFSSML